MIEVAVRVYYQDYWIPPSKSSNSAVPITPQVYKVLLCRLFLQPFVKEVSLLVCRCEKQVKIKVSSGDVFSSVHKLSLSGLKIGIPLTFIKVEK